MLIFFFLIAICLLAIVASIDIFPEARDTAAMKADFKKFCKNIEK